MVDSSAFGSGFGNGTDKEFTTIEMNANQPLLKNAGVFKPFIVSLRDCFSDEEVPDIKLKIVQGQKQTESQVSVDEYCSFLYRTVDYNSTQSAWMLCTGNGIYIHPWEHLSLYEEHLRKNPQIVKAPKVNAAMNPDDQLNGKDYNVWNFLAFMARGMCAWSFLCFFIVTVAMMCTFVIDLIVTIYVAMTNEELSSLVKYSYALSVTAIAATVIYFFAVWLLLQGEIYTAFDSEIFNCPTLHMYMPVTMSRVSKSADLFRVGIVITWCLITVVLVAVDYFIDLPIHSNFADNEGGSLIMNFLGCFGLVIGAIFSLIYTVVAVGVDCYGIYKVLHDGCYLTQYLEWVPFNPDVNYTRTTWFFWTRAKVPEDLRNNFSTLRFIGWVHFHSWVPWLIIAWPMLNIWVLGYGMTTRGVVIFTLWPFIIFFVQSLRHYRLRCHRFSDRDETEDKRRIDDRNALTNYFIAIAVILMIAALVVSTQSTVMSAENELDKQNGSFPIYVTKNPGRYPVCESEFFNHDMIPVVESDILDSVDIITIVGAIYLVDTESKDDKGAAVNQELKKYFGDKFCDEKDVSKCNSHQWRIVHESYDVDPVFFHAYLPASKYHIVSIRGTASVRDALMDMVLWVEISVLQYFATIFPVFEIWTVDIIEEIINLGSSMHDVVSRGKVADYYDSPLKYLQENKIPNDSNREYLMIAGHSLGGGVAQIVAGKIYDTQSKRVRAFNLAGPGIGYSARKFGVSADALKFTGFTLYGIGDPVAKYDKQKGTVNEIDCESPIRTYCHYREQTQCELAYSCYNDGEIANLSKSKAAYLHKQCPTPFISDKAWSV